MSSVIHDAAAGVILHEGRVLLARRHEQLKAFPGYWAFPGGKVGPEDRRDDEDAALALQRALVREVREEIGVDIAGMLADHQVSDIAELGSATTPHFAPHRFATRFYCIRLRVEPALALQADEITDTDWRTPEEWLNQWRRGRLLCAPPTLAVLEALASDPDQPPAPDFRERFGSDGATAWYEPVAGLRILAVHSKTIPPALHTNCFYIVDGDSGGILVDPSPADDDAFDRLHATVAPWPLDAVMLTHHHPDHNERANRLARERDVPLLCSADTRARVAAREGADWFDGITVRELAEGDTIGRWMTEPVRVIAVPGHDAGQLAPLPDSRAWCVVSDLIQGIGTVVVGGDEGDMAAYFRSLERVIDLDPAVIVPSHGMAMGGTWKLAQTLAHRRERESQVLALHAGGADVDAMLETIYGADTPAFLMPLARLNINAHLDKLRDEGRLEATADGT